MNTLANPFSSAQETVLNVESNSSMDHIHQNLPLVRVSVSQSLVPEHTFQLKGCIRKPTPILSWCCHLGVLMPDVTVRKGLQNNASQPSVIQS